MQSHEFKFKMPFGETIDCRFLDDAGTTFWLDRLRSYPEIRMGEIGVSRAGRTMYGLMVGHGESYMSITAGAHADEPAGPITACLLAAFLAGESPQAAELRDAFTWLICPQVNPDGAEANKGWFAPIPDFETYLKHVKREGPGDDIEFGYPDMRPENKAVAEFLEAGAPFEFHASLHSMGVAEGAWMLVGKPISGKIKGLINELSHYFLKSGFQLHDIERRGDKGFSRIAPGFCTTPTSVAMRKHFEKLGDFEQADKFSLSSMEFIQLDNPSAIVMVTELPVFTINGGYVKGRSLPKPSSRVPKPGMTQYEKFRAGLRDCMDKNDMDGALELGKKFDIQPVPFEVQCATQLDILMIMSFAMANHNDQGLD